MNNFEVDFSERRSEEVISNFEVDFSERRSEEVIRFFWRSVYIANDTHQWIVCTWKICT